MLVTDAITQAQALTGQVVAQSVLLRWLSELDGQLAIEFYGAGEWAPYTTDDLQSALAVPYPWDGGVYVHYLEAMTYFSNGEYERYENARAMSEEKLGEFRRYVQRMKTGCGKITVPLAGEGGTGVTVIGGGEQLWTYLSAYGTAVRHGFEGTPEQWLASLVGEKGDQGDPGTALNYKGEYAAGIAYVFNDCVMYENDLYIHIGEESTTGTDPTDTDTWSMIFSASDAADVIAAHVADAEAAATAAATAQASASGSASAAAGSASAASFSAHAASVSASAADTAKAAAAVSASAAAISASAAATAQSAAESAQTAAETAQGKAEDAQSSAENAQAAAETAQGIAEAAQTGAESAQAAAETAQSKAEDAQDAAESAQTAASVSAQAASVSEHQAAARASAAAARASAAAGSADDASFSEHQAAVSAQQAAARASAAAGSASAASFSEQQAAVSAHAAETAQGKAEDAQDAAETAQAIAETAASSAAGSALAAAGSASAAATAQAAAESAQTAAETAQGKAEDAQAAAEAAQTAAEASAASIEQSAEQIDANTARIGYLALREEEDRQILFGSVVEAVEDTYAELASAPIHNSVTIGQSVYPRLDNTRLGLDRIKGRTVVDGDVLVAPVVSGWSVEDTDEQTTTLPLPSTRLDGVGTAQDVLYVREDAENDYTLIERSAMGNVDLSALSWMVITTGSVNKLLLATLSDYYSNQREVRLSCMGAPYMFEGHSSATQLRPIIDTATVGAYLYSTTATTPQDENTIYLVVPISASPTGNFVYPVSSPTETVLAEHLTLADISAIAENGGIVSIVNSNGDVVQPDLVVDTVISRSAQSQ